MQSTAKRPIDTKLVKKLILGIMHHTAKDCYDVYIPVQSPLNIAQQVFRKVCRLSIEEGEVLYELIEGYHEDKDPNDYVTIRSDNTNKFERISLYEMLKAINSDAAVKAAVKFQESEFRDKIVNQYLSNGYFWSWIKHSIQRNEQFEIVEMSSEEIKFSDPLLANRIVDHFIESLSQTIRDKQTLSNIGEIVKNLDKVLINA